MTNHFVKTCQASTLIITLNRPEKRNALTREMVSGLCCELDGAMTDESITGVVITGSGSAFCAGMDLSILEQTEHDPESVHGFMAELHDLYVNILQTEKTGDCCSKRAGCCGGRGLGDCVRYDYCF